MNAAATHSIFKAYGLSGRSTTDPVLKRAFDYSFIFAPKEHSLFVKPFDAKPHAWLKDIRIKNSLAYINQEHGRSTRRYGNNIPEMAHILWVAHKNYNNPILRETLAHAGIDPVLAAFVGLHHDTIEAACAKAKKEGRTADREAILKTICSFWDDPKDYPIIHETVLVYLTDDEGLTGIHRIDVQKNKPVNRTNDPVITVLNVCSRAADKTHHILMDAYMHRQYLAARKKGRLRQIKDAKSHRKFGLPDTEIEAALIQATVKRYAALVLHALFADAATEELKTYDETLAYFSRQRTRMRRRGKRTINDLKPDQGLPYNGPNS